MNKFGEKRIKELNTFKHGKCTSCMCMELNAFIYIEWEEKTLFIVHSETEHIRGAQFDGLSP